VAVGFAFLVLHAFRSGCDHDEVEQLHASWLVAQGYRPFQDFLEQRPPTLYYFLAPLTRAFEDSPRALVVSTRALDLGLLAIALAAFAALVRPLLRHRQVAWAPLLLLGCFFFARNSIEVRPDLWMSVLCLIGFWQWSIYLRGGKASHAAIAGICLGAAIAFLQKAALFVGLMGLGTALALRDRASWVRAAKGLGWLAVAALVPLGALAGAIGRAGYWSDFVFWNFTFNKFYYLEARFRGPGAPATLATSIGEDPLLWVAGLVGVVLAGRALGHRRPPPEIAISAVLVLGTLIALSRSHWPFSHNLLLMQPALAVLAAFALDALRSPHWRLAAGALLLAMIAKLCVLCLFYDENRDAVEVQQRLLSATRSTDKIAVSPPYHPVFRSDAFFFWIVPTNNAVAYLDCCRAYPCPPGKVDRDRRAWQLQPPRFVYVPPGEPGWAPFEFDQHKGSYHLTSTPGLWELN